MGACLSSEHNLQMILCYGDSLTAGTSPPGTSMFPYAAALERALKELPGDKHVTVKHRGLPGWTSKEMLRVADQANSGLRQFISQDPAPSLVVILAGTNDLADACQAQPVVECISALHKLCWDSGVAKTAAVGIPESFYQIKNPHALDLCCEVNEGLKTFCESDPRAIYVPFPFGFQRDVRWAPDGLHLTEEGYNLLGTSLAPFIAEIVKS